MNNTELNIQDKKTYAIYVLASYIGILLIICSISIFLNMYLIPPIMELKNSVNNINIQCEILEEQLNISKSELFEIYKADWKTVMIQDKEEKVISYNTIKGVKEMVKRSAPTKLFRSIK